MSDRIEEVVRDTYRYFYVDGLVEISVGFLFLAIGLLLLAWVNMDNSSWPGVLAVLALVVVTMGGSFAVKRLVGLVKERLTYRRTGYVAYERGEPRAGRWPVIAAALFMVLLLFVLPEALEKMSFVIGGLLGFLLAYMGYRVSLARFYLIGAVTFLIGLAATFLVRDELVGATLIFAGSGLILFVSGAIVLLGYLQANPPLQEE